MEFQNNPVLTYEGCFGFYRAVNAKESRLRENNKYSLRFKSSCEHVTLQGWCDLSYSLLSLAFTARWNPKHPSYVSTRLFCNSKLLFCVLVISDVIFLVAKSSKR